MRKLLEAVFVFGGGITLGILLYYFIFGRQG